MLDRSQLCPLGLSALLGCSSASIEGRLATLEAEEARRQAKLDALKQQITAAELRAEHAKALAQYHDCKATSASLKAEVTLQRASCVQEIAAHTECIATNEKNTSDATAAGCLIGIGLAVLTGGAAAPLGLAGCAGGAVVGHATKAKCGEMPRCASHINSMERVVLARQGLGAMPTCIEPTEPELPEPPAPSEPAAPVVVQPAPVEQRTICTDQRVAWVEFVVPARKADGRTWDAREGSPDLRYTIYVEGQKRYESEVYETLSWRHQPQAEVRVAPQQQISIQLLDSDQQTSETIAVFRSIIAADTSDALNVSVGAVTARIKLECVDE